MGQYILDDAVFPISANNQFASGPQFATTLFLNAPGDAQPQRNQDEALWRFTYTFLRNSSDYGAVTAFFLERRGMGYAFWVDDPYDHADDDNGGTGKVVQLSDGNKYLVKQYGSVRPYYRVIRGADPESISFSGVGGSPVYVPGTGQITGASGGGNATFTFKVPVRFDSDLFEVARDPAFGRVDGVRMVELRSFVIAS